MKKVLVVGATGSTGKLLVKQLIEEGVKVIAIVRNPGALITEIKDQSLLELVTANISDMSVDKLIPYLRDCDAIVSCLGHNLTFNGMFGKPRFLVTDSIKALTSATITLNPAKKTKFILMNTTGNSNRDIPEKPPLSQRCVISVLRLLLPPHLDNENAADFLRVKIGQAHKNIEWVAVRPDSLTDEACVSDYDVHASPTRNAIFDSAPTSRHNVADFMSNLILNDELWHQWTGKMPVIYNRL